MIVCIALLVIAMVLTVALPKTRPTATNDARSPGVPTPA
jgi:hypothetical protein